MAPSTIPALAHDTACSALRPPKTTATRTLRADPMHHLRCFSQPEDGSRCPAQKNLSCRFVPNMKICGSPPVQLVKLPNVFVLRLRAHLVAVSQRDRPMSALTGPPVNPDGCGAQPPIAGS